MMKYEYRQQYYVMLHPYNMPGISLYCHYTPLKDLLEHIASYQVPGITYRYQLRTTWPATYYLVSTFGSHSYRPKSDVRASNQRRLRRKSLG